MYTITEKKYASISKDYRGVYDSDHIHGTNFDGKRTLLTWLQGEGTVLLIEGQSLNIVKTEEENTNKLFFDK